MIIINNIISELLQFFGVYFPGRHLAVIMVMPSMVVVGNRSSSCTTALWFDWHCWTIMAQILSPDGSVGRGRCLVSASTTTTIRWSSSVRNWIVNRIGITSATSLPTQWPWHSTSSSSSGGGNCGGISETYRCRMSTRWISSDGWVVIGTAEIFPYPFALGLWNRIEKLEWTEYWRMMGDYCRPTL